MSILSDRNLKIERLERQLADAEGQAASLAVERDMFRTERNAIHDRLFVRHDVMSMTREQLISLANECINEARRKGLVEAEGLINRHRELEEQTDVEMMQGVVDVYTKRIAAVKAKVEKPIQLDTRPLTERVPELPQPQAWWSVSKLPTTKTLTVGQQTTVKGSKGGTYILRHSSDKVYTCTCPAWQFATVPAEERTCKHLGAYLGLKTEETRVMAAKQQKSCWCGVILVNGQCQVHTNNWKGDERCNCGRLLSFCKEEYSRGNAPTRAWHTPRLLGTPEPVFKP